MIAAALISTPWPLYNRPSIQLGALKAYLRKHLKQIRVDTHHLYLDVAEHIGYEVYSFISESSWLSEALYAYILFPEKQKDIQRFLKLLKKKNPRLNCLEIEKIKEDLCNCLEKHVENIDWETYDIIGFSICFSQLMSSLLYMSKIKERYPNSFIVAGGSHCSDKLGKSLINTFDFIDLIVEGEGEQTLLNICKALIEKRPLEEIEDLPGVISRSKEPSGPCQLIDLDELPTPDYDDYFQHLERLPKKKKFFAKIPLEGSRGCWYRGFKGKGCAFCNLNLQWKGYRQKNIEQVLSEIETYVTKYKTISLSFMDNLIPRDFVPGLFEALISKGRDLRIFLESRAGISLEHLKLMRKGGVEEIQVGIEALSTSLLQKMNKGTTAIQNIEIMKACELHDTPNLTSNLILDFPLSDEEDAKETLYNMEFVRHLRPLKPISFWLGFGSKIYNEHQNYGIRRVYNHIYYRYLIPENIFKRLCLMIQGYTSKNPQKNIWKDVRKKVSQWQKKYLHLKKYKFPILAFYDAKDFLIISEIVDEKKEHMHRLTGRSREIYLFCERRRHIQEILSAFPSLSYEKVHPFLEELVSKRLMFKERDEYLSLAIKA